VKEKISFILMLVLMPLLLPGVLLAFTGLLLIGGVVMLCRFIDGKLGAQ
jgi:hypothetical protein